MNSLPDSAKFGWELSRSLPAAADDPVALAVITNNLGMTYRDVSRNEAALETFREALRHHDRHPSIHAAAAWTNIGLEYLRFGNLDEAERAISESLRQSVSPPYPYTEVYALLGGAAVANCRSYPMRRTRASSWEGLAHVALAPEGIEGARVNLGHSDGGA